MGRKKNWFLRSRSGQQKAPDPIPVNASQSIAGVRILHAATKWQEEVDAYMDGKRMVRRLPYGAITNYVSVHSGDSYLQISRNQTPDGAILSQILSVRDGKLCTLALIDSKDPSKKIPKLMVIPDLIVEKEEVGQVRFVHLSSHGPIVDLLANDRVIFHNVPFTHLTRYVPIQPGQVELKLQITDTRKAQQQKVSFPLFSRQIISIFYIGDDQQGHRLVLVQDR